MQYPQIELWLYDTRQELEREARAGKVCVPADLPVLGIPRQEKDLAARKALVEENSRAGIPTRISFSAEALADLAGPLLLAAAWQHLPIAFGAAALRRDGWADQPMTLHYHGFTGPILPRNLPLFPPDFPLQPYPLQALLRQAVAARRRALAVQPRPFPLQAFLRDAGEDGEALSEEADEGAALLRDWKLCSRLPDRGVFADDRLWDAPLSYRYPAAWFIEERCPLHCTAAYTAWLTQKHPNWPALLCRAIRDLPAGARRWMLVWDDFSPNPAETVLGGHCLGFAVEDKTRTITITRDDDARAEFLQALEAYHRDLHVPQGDTFPFVQNCDI